MALMPCNTGGVSWYPNAPTTSTYTLTASCPTSLYLIASLYLIDCMHCGEKFVTKPRKSAACIQSMETCWDVECPKCAQEIRLCLHECKCDCDHVLDCLLIGITDKVIERALELEFEKGAEVHRYEPYGPPSYNPWDITGGTPNITYGGSTAIDYTASPFSMDIDAITISFKDRLDSTDSTDEQV